MSYHLLLVSHDSAVVSLLSSLTSPSGDRFTIETAKTGTQALKDLPKLQSDFMLLDMEIPDMRGIDCLKILRQTEQGRNLPVIVLSTHKVDDDVAEAFEWGADDYVLKDCDTAEFSARIRAVLRRRLERELHMGQAMSSGPVELDPVRHLCRVRGREIRLRAREFELLEILMRKAGRVLSRSYLLETVWGMSRLADTRAVDVAVSRLRKALGRRAGGWIETIERFGYRFRSASGGAR